MDQGLAELGTPPNPGGLASSPADHTATHTAWANPKTAVHWATAQTTMSDGWSEQETGTKQLQLHHFLAPKLVDKAVKCGHLNVSLTSNLAQLSSLETLLDTAKSKIWPCTEGGATLNLIPGPNSLCSGVKTRKT